MRNFALCTLCVLAAACGDDEKTIRPVDAKFSATVQGDGVPEGTVVSVDVYWLGDDKVDVRFDDVEDVIPGPDELKGVGLKPGNDVLNEGPVPLEDGGDPHQVRLEGNIDPNALDLELSDTPPGDATVTVRLQGDARPMSSVDALDGEYLVFTERYPAHCPGDDRPPLPGRNIPLDVLATGDGARLTIDGYLVFSVPIASGSVDWTGDIRFRQYPSSFEAAVSGTLLPYDVALTLDVPDPDSGDGCVDRLVVTGAKRLPVPAAIDGDYRADYVWTDECPGGGEGRFSSSLELIAQDEGMVDFFEFNGGWMQFSMTPGEPFTGDFWDVFGSGAIIAYDGIASSPDLPYTATYEYPFSPPCLLTLEVTSYKRYFFPEEASTSRSLRQEVRRDRGFRLDRHPPRRGSLALRAAPPERGAVWSRLIERPLERRFLPLIK